MELTKSPVVFDRIAHKYYYDGKELNGITGLLHAQLFPGMYSDVPEDVLRRAAEKGTFIHEQCEIADTLNTDDVCAEAVNYRKLTNGLKHEATEYLVSDLQSYASCIDKVYRVSEDEFILADIKTTYALNRDYVMWQLSIYAYLFEAQNPGAKVTGLYAIWLRNDKAEFVALPRVEADEVIKLLDSGVTGEQYVTPYTLPTEFRAMEMEICSWYKVMDETEAKIKALEARLKDAMDANNVTKFESASLVITRKADYTRKSLDGKALKAEHPDIYNQYEKETTCKGGISIKVKV